MKQKINDLEKMGKQQEDMKWKVTEHRKETINKGQKLLKTTITGYTKDKRFVQIYSNQLEKQKKVKQVHREKEPERK